MWIECGTPEVLIVYACDTYRAYQKKTAIRSRGKSRQIAAKRGKIRQISFLKKMAITFFKKLRRIASQRATQKKNGDHFGGEIVALFGVHHFNARGAIYFFNLRYRGGLGHGLYPTKPLSNFLSIVFRIITIFLNL